MKILYKNKVFSDSFIGVTCKLISAAIGFTAVPVLIHILGIENYGKWVTLISVIGWFQLMDFGIANGLKNKIAKCYAINDFSSVKVYYVGAVQLFFFISCSLLVVVLLFGQLLSMEIYLVNLLYIPFILFLPLTLGTAFLSGARKNGLLACLNLINPIGWIIIITIFAYGIFPVGLVEIILGWNIVSFLGLIVVFVYSTKCLDLPIRSFFLDRHILQVKDIMQSSFQFFALQISSLVLFSIGNIMTYSFLGATDAARFDTVNKLFLFGISLFNIIIATVWPEFTTYFSKNMFKDAWILYKKLLLFSIGMSGIVLASGVLVPNIIEFWTGGKIQVTQWEALPFALLVSAQMIAYSGAVVLNAREKVSGQIVLGISSAFILFVVSIFLFKLNFGIATIPLASFIAILPSLVYCNYKARCIILRQME